MRWNRLRKILHIWSTAVTRHAHVLAFFCVEDSTSEVSLKNMFIRTQDDDDGFILSHDENTIA